MIGISKYVVETNFGLRSGIMKMSLFSLGLPSNLQSQDRRTLKVTTYEDGREVTHYSCNSLNRKNRPCVLSTLTLGR